jgi:hypothetical protein
VAVHQLQWAGFGYHQEHKHGRRERIVLWVLTVFFSPGAERAPRLTTRKIDRSLSIVLETAQNLNRVNSRLKSKARNFDGLMVGF